MSRLDPHNAVNRRAVKARAIAVAAEADHRKQLAILAQASGFLLATLLALLLISP